MIKKIPQCRYSSQSYRTIKERGTLDTPNTYIHDQTAHFPGMVQTLQWKMPKLS